MARRSDHSRAELRELVLTTAERIAETEGFSGLGARRIMREVGYTIGTFYQLFGRYDDLIVELNGRTLDALYAACETAPQEGSPETRLGFLADRYVAFTHRHPKRWSILFEHRLPDGDTLPEWHHEKIQRLLFLCEDALRPLFPEDQDKARLHAARVLWSSLHGICSLESAGKLVETESVDAMAKTLIDTFVAGLRASANPAAVFRP